MRDKPAAAELLEVAREMLLEHVIPALPSGQKYNALMVASAMAIAMRELQGGERYLDEEFARLTELMGGGAENEDHAGLFRRFAAELRIGAFDDPGARRDAALEILRASTLARLRECNPRYLESEN